MEGVCNGGTGDVGVIDCFWVVGVVEKSDVAIDGDGFSDAGEVDIDSLGSR